jgi:enterochelin esterase-like enzyme
MKSWGLLLSLLFLLTSGQAQESSYFANTFNILISGDSSEIEKTFYALETESKIPLILNDSVLFLYRGNATTVEWMGDFNGWGYVKDFPNKGRKIANTDIWYLKCKFPQDARLDYKILIDGVNWIIDPVNKLQQWSGVGGGSPNSELRMPKWVEDDNTLFNVNAPKGELIRDALIISKSLGYQVTYSVYLPHNYKQYGPLPVAYVTDGYEYLHPQLGNMTTTLDNLIHSKKIQPVITVFVDNREPVNRANNRRMNELAMNSKYLDFFANELIPTIQSQYPVKAESKTRAIIGTSMGGLTATYFAFTRPDLFGLAGIQSPAFYTRPQIYNLCEANPDAQLKISMTTGLINDTSTDSRKMSEILKASSCVYQYREVNEGHSWGNWRRLIDDVLVDLFGK